MPDVSFLIAAYNAEQTIEAAIASALAQSKVTVEVIVVDDVSSDETLSCVSELSKRDPRVVVLPQPHNAGPAAARNRALAAARGDWVAIIDADDYIAPNRSEQLIGLAKHSSSEIVADNVLRFRHDAPQITWPLLPKRPGDQPFAVDLEHYLRHNKMTGGDANLGYLKPMFSRSFLQSNAIVYDEGLRIGEDFNFVLRALGAGARFTVTPEIFYFYRVMAGSLSRQLTVVDLEQLLVATDRVLADQGAGHHLDGAAAAYRQAVLDLAAFSEFRGHVRRGEWLSALRGATAPRLWGTAAKMLAHASQRRHVQALARRRSADRYRAGSAS
ncbi:glycosyltransferase family 2 protein [Labrys neptuniae]